MRNRIDDPELRRLRALAIIQRRIMGVTMGSLAKEFNCTVDTIRREIDYAKRSNLVADFEEQILEGLVPEAIAALKTALQGGDTTAALEVLKGMGVLKKQSAKSITEPTPEVEEDSLSVHIKKISKKAGGSLGRSSGELQLPAGAASDVIEGSVLESSADSAAAAAPSVGAAGGEGRAANAQGHVGISHDPSGLFSQPPTAPAGSATGFTGGESPEASRVDDE